MSELNDIENNYGMEPNKSSILACVPGMSSLVQCSVAATIIDVTSCVLLPTKTKIVQIFSFRIKLTRTQSVSGHLVLNFHDVNNRLNLY